MSTETVSVSPVFFEYLEQNSGTVVESNSEVEEAFRDAVKDLHPDKSGGDTGEEFKQIVRARKKLKDRVEEKTCRVVELEEDRGEESLSFLEEYLASGFSSHSKEAASNYSIRYSRTGEENFTAVLDDSSSDLRVGLEIAPSDDLHLDVGLNYFVDNGESRQLDGRIDLRDYYGEDPEDEVPDALGQSFEKAGEWAVRYAEELKLDYF